MSEALPLPPKPSLAHYEALADDLHGAGSDAEGIRNWVVRLLETVATGQVGQSATEKRRRVDVEAERMERRWREQDARNASSDARDFVARLHGFAGWAEFAPFVKAVADSSSPVAKFEAAIEAIVCGDLATLQRLLSENPELVRARSMREHRSTLLHYVSANGVEDFRQRTPQNIVEIAKLLLDAGADVNAESEAYGGRSTTLGLTATSCHPEDAGVQLPLLELLIDRGGVIDGPDGDSAVNGCLHNGRGAAAEFFAIRGAQLDLEGAAGVGRLDIVKTYFNGNGSLKENATKEQMQDGFAWACQFGRSAVVEFLLQHGIQVDAALKHHGQTGLHWAAYGGHAEIVALLLQRGASVNSMDESFGGTPLGWSLYAWGGLLQSEDRGYHETVALLVKAGAVLDSPWYEDDEDRRRALAKARSDALMLAALRGESPV